MKIECVLEKLHKAVQRGERIASKHVTLPVLSGVLLRAEDGVLTLNTFNLELSVEVSIPAKVTTAGVVVVPADILSRYLGLARGNNVTLSVEGGVLKVESGTDKAELKLLPADDFPVLPRLSGQVSEVTTTAQVVSEGIKNVVYATAVSSMKPELSSVLLYEGDNHHLVCAATDGFRLAEKQVTADVSGFTRTLLPHKNALEVVRILGESDTQLTIRFDEHLLVFETEDEVRVTTKIVPGEYPDYRKLITETGSTKALLLKRDLLDVIKRATVFANTYNRLTLTFVPGDNICRVEIRNDEIGAITSELEGKVEGEELTLSYNYRHLADCLTSINSESVECVLNGQGKPLLLKGQGDTSFRYILMPLTRT